MKYHVLAAVLFAAAATPAAAVTSYVKPAEFWTTEEDISVEGAYASQFFTPQIGVGETLTVTNPEGESVFIDRLAVTPTRTTLQADLRTGGTYRITTGEQFGQVANLVGVEGSWQVLGDGQMAPEGAPTTTLQPVTVADAYVTRGTASRENVDRTIGRLAIRPITHPNQVLASQGFQVEIRFDDAPLANSAVVLYRAGDADNDLDTYVVTDAAGVANFTFDAPGQYVVAARHRAEMPPGSDAEVGSYTTTLTFEALAALPVETEVVEQTAQPQEPSRARRPARRRVGRPDY